MGIKDRKIKTLGFPVSQKFFQKHNKKALREKYNLNEKLFTILVIASHSKTQRVLSTIKHIIPFCENIQVVIVTGKNETVLKKFKKMNPPKNIHLLGWTDNIAELMHLSDVIVTKAGGATVQEAIAARKPLIIHDNLPGQEVGNVDYILNTKIGLIMVKNRPTEIACKLLQLSHNDSKEMRELKYNMEKVYKHNSTEEIGKFVGKILRI
jgi:processive 1,2-diacylglycerol beta-glucosyltransferase